MGVSVESADYLDRLNHLRATRAAVLFVSLEPLLGSVAEVNLTSIDWAIVGGESGPKARPMKEATGSVPQIRHGLFFKQWGGRNKKRHGRTLDGQTWDEFPGANAHG